jgi:hypothetical protein
MRVSTAALTLMLNVVCRAARETHAALYTLVDLSPPSGFGACQGWAIGGSQQVGYGMPIGSNAQHALLWNGAAVGFVDLTPSGFARPGNQRFPTGRRCCGRRLIPCCPLARDRQQLRGSQSCGLL